MRTTSLALVPALALFACTGHVDIGPDTSGGNDSAGSGHGHHGTQGGVGGGTAGVGGGTVATTAVGTSATAVSSTSVSTGAGGSSCCSMQRSVTAENDVGQLVSGLVNTPGKVVDGPFVLTDAYSGSATLVLVQGSDCAATAGQLPIMDLQPGQREIHGSRVFVPVGATLCASNSVVFSGFRPY